MFKWYRSICNKILDKLIDFYMIEEEKKRILKAYIEIRNRCEEKSNFKWYKRGDINEQ